MMPIIMRDAQDDNSKLKTQNSKLSLVAAVFDVDRTLVPVTTTERVFIRYLFRRHVIGLKAVLNTGLFMVKRLPQSPFETIRRERAYLAGQPYEETRHLALQCFETDIKPRISKAGIAALQDHKA